MTNIPIFSVFEIKLTGFAYSISYMIRFLLSINLNFKFLFMFRKYRLEVI